ncbi:MAG: NAD(P)H-binding protein [Streptomycetales bacterium]
MSEDIVAVTGATGAVGGRVARQLAAAGAGQRLVVRDQGRAPQLRGARPAVGPGYRDGAAMRRAFDGATTVFLVSGRESADRVHEHATAVDAAVAAGVEGIVYLSFLGAAPDCTFTFGRDHWHTEQHIRASGLRFTFLRDSFYLALLPAMAGPDGIIRGPAGQGRVATVAQDDVAGVAAAVLLGDGHDGATYDVTGPAAVSLYEAADELSRAAGRPITYHPESVDEAYASRAGFGVPEFELAGWVSSYQAIAAGELSAVSDAVARLTGHRPQTLREYLRANPDAYRHLTDRA